MCTRSRRSRREKKWPVALDVWWWMQRSERSAFCSFVQMRLDTMTMWLLSSRYYADSLYEWCIYCCSSFILLCWCYFYSFLSRSHSRLTGRHSKKGRTSWNQWREKSKNAPRTIQSNLLPAHASGMRDTSKIPQVVLERWSNLHTKHRVWDRDVLFPHYHCSLRHVHSWVMISLCICSPWGFVFFSILISPNTVASELLTFSLSLSPSSSSVSQSARSSIFHPLSLVFV